MRAIILIPGIMGTRLKLRNEDGSVEEVWPPTPWEAVNGYGRLNKLLSDNIQVGAIIDSVALGCYKVYQPLLEDLDAIVASAPGTLRVTPFPYDWRLDLFSMADLLAQQLATESKDADKITLIGHSMGGLIARLVLESPKYQAESWHAKIDQFIAMATPHRGAPLALARVLGLDSALGISAADFKTLAADPRYPSGYQLLPWQGDAVMWNRNPATSPPLSPVNFYAASAPAGPLFGLNQQNLQKATALQRALGPAAVRPPHVRYITFAGTRYETLSRIDLLPGGGDSM